MSKFKNENQKMKRKDTIKKFQEAVWKAYKMKKDGEEEKLYDKNVDTVKSLNT